MKYIDINLIFLDTANQGLQNTFLRTTKERYPEALKQVTALVIEQTVDTPDAYKIEAPNGAVHNIIFDASGDVFAVVKTIEVEVHGAPDQGTRTMLV